MFAITPPLSSLVVPVTVLAPAPIDFSVEIVGDWQVRVIRSGSSDVTLTIAPPAQLVVKDERYDTLREFNEKAAPWTKGTRLKGLITFETSAPDMLVPESVRLKSGSGDAPLLKEGTDYRIDGRWATVGFVPGGKAQGVPIWADYTYGRGRVDSIVQDGAGRVTIRQGEPDNATPHPPTLAPGERLLYNLWIRGRAERLTKDALFPVIEPVFPNPTGPAPAQALLPKTWAKLTGKQKLHILAWGDSVTAGGQASDTAHHYQEVFLARLRRRFPDADIQLTTVAWGGRNTASFLAEPPGSAYNFQEKVLDAHPDLVVMEFVNDSGLSNAQVEERYSGLLERFHKIGAEWVILTPHLVWGEWMGVGTAQVEKDPRPYVASLRQFVANRKGEPGLALADGSRRWEHLVKEGIPYQTLLCNSLNHPDDRGHALFADALMELFGAP